MRRKRLKDTILETYAEATQTNKELLDAKEELEAFSYIISHDLRAPLRSIDGFATILKEEYAAQLDVEGVKMLDSILESAAKMNDFIQDILTYSRASKAHLIMNELPLKTEFLKQIEPLQQRANKEGRNVEWVIPESFPTVFADQSTLEILLQNLLTNAYKYSSPQDPARIEIGAGIKGEYVRFYVRDNGIGFDMHYADRIFDIFSRLVNEDEYEGTGIGLAIVKRIVDKHGGSVEVQSELEKETTFYINMPLK